jgi:hypothetical protein
MRVVILYLLGARRMRAVDQWEMNATRARRIACVKWRTEMMMSTIPWKIPITVEGIKAIRLLQKIPAREPSHLSRILTMAMAKAISPSLADCERIGDYDVVCMLGRPMLRSMPWAM